VGSPAHRARTETAAGVIAVDGKTLRGSGNDQENGRHLLAAFDHAHGVVLGQVEVGAPRPSAHPPTADDHEVLVPRLITSACVPSGATSRPRAWPAAALIWGKPGSAAGLSAGRATLGL
jgi:hypothetical protein